MVRAVRGTAVTVMLLASFVVIGLLASNAWAVPSEAWPEGKTVASGTLHDGSSTWYLSADQQRGCFDLTLSVGGANGGSEGCGVRRGTLHVSTDWAESGSAAAGVAVVVAPAGTRGVRVTTPVHGHHVTRIVRRHSRPVGGVVVFVSELLQNTRTDAIAVRSVR
jgi:hypothetical protein